MLWVLGTFACSLFAECNNIHIYVAFTRQSIAIADSELVSLFVTGAALREAAGYFFVYGKRIFPTHNENNINYKNVNKNVYAKFCHKY